MIANTFYGGFHITHIESLIMRMTSVTGHPEFLPYQQSQFITQLEEITDYLENGNIRNSVNFPACDMGVCSQAGRIAVLHKNVPNIISGLTTVFGQSGINIDKMMNQSRGEYAYSIIDIDKAGAKDIADEIATKEGILKVRVIK